jgi:hypothetical protein
VNGDRARGDWTPWPIVAGQLDLPLDPEPAPADDAQGSDQGER